jgi:selenocysteine-specific translation elongation factor
MAEEKSVGKIIHYYTNIGVGIIELFDTLNAGDKIHVKGSSTDFEQTVDSMQVEHQNVETAKAGESIGVKLNEKVREGDEVFKVAE